MQAKKEEKLSDIRKENRWFATLTYLASHKVEDVFFRIPFLFWPCGRKAVGSPKRQTNRGVRKCVACLVSGLENQLRVSVVFVAKFSPSLGCSGAGCIPSWGGLDGSRPGGSFDFPVSSHFWMVRVCSFPKLGKREIWANAIQDFFLEVAKIMVRRSSIGKHNPGEIGIPKVLVGLMPPPSEHKTADPATARAAMRRYRRAVVEIRLSRRVCESCGRNANEAGQRKLYCHHLQPVGTLEGGLASDLATNPANLLLLCNDCHALFHPGIRRYPWAVAAGLRGKAFQKTFRR